MGGPYQCVAERINEARHCSREPNNNEGFTGTFKSTPGGVKPPGLSPERGPISPGYAAARSSTFLTEVCQSEPKFDPRSASNFDPLWRRVLAVALAPSERVGVAETARARVVG